MIRHHHHAHPESDQRQVEHHQHQVAKPHGRHQPPEQRRLLGHDGRAGLDALNDHRADHQRHHRVGRNAQRQHRDERGLRTGVVCRLRRRHAFDGPLAEIGLVLRHFLFQCVSGKGRKHRPAAGQDAENRAEHGAAHGGCGNRLEIFLVQHQPGHFLDHQAALAFILKVADDLAEPENAHGHHHEVDAIDQIRHIEAVTCYPGVNVGTDNAEQQAEHDHPQRVNQRAVRQHHRGHQAEYHQRKIFGWAEFQGDFGQRRRKQRDQHGGHRTGEERNQRRRRQCFARPPLLGHRVPVKRRDNRGRFTRQIDENCRGRTAVLGTVEDPGEHDQRRHRRQAESDRQQHGDGRHRT